MSKRVQGTGRNTSRKIRRLVLIGMIVAVLALGATAAISRRTSQAKNPTPRPSSGQTSDTRANLSLRAGAQHIPLDPQTGQVRPLTQEEAQEMANGIKQLVNQSTDGLQSVRHADGTVSMDLQGRFQSIAVAKRDEDGKLTQSCIDNPRAAAVFFEIDPQLVGVHGDATSPKRNKTMPEKGRDQ